jgi:Tol biopolymer transport system component
LPGPVNSSAADVQIVLTDRQGAIQTLKIPVGPYAVPRVSPDGNRIAFESNDGKESLIYVYDLAGATTMQRLTFGGNNRHPAWSGDGKRVAYQSDREGDAGVWWQLADGSGSSERLTKPETGEMHVPLSFTRDGQYLLVGTNRGTTAHSMALLSVATKQLTRFERIASTTPPAATFSPTDTGSPTDDGDERDDGRRAVSADGREYA